MGQCFYKQTYDPLPMDDDHILEPPPSAFREEQPPVEDFEVVLHKEAPVSWAVQRPRRFPRFRR
jgi:hypothetical protein